MSKRVIPGVLLCLCVFVSISNSSTKTVTEGVFIAHHPPGLQYSRGTDWCEKYHDDVALVDWKSQHPRIDLDGTQDLSSVWYVIAAFTDSTHWSGVEFGFGDYDATIYKFIEWGPCSPAAVLELSSPGWPGPLKGTAIVCAGGDPWSGNCSPVYYFVGNAYNEGVIPLGIDPQTDFGGTATNTSPVHKRQAEAFGAMGIFQDGVSVEPVKRLAEIISYDQMHGQATEDSDLSDRLLTTLARWQHHPTGPELSTEELLMDPTVVLPIRISAADATEDVERLFYLLENGYCGYGYFSQENSFETARAGIVSDISTSAHWSPGDLAELVRRHLDFITDCHMRLGSVRFAGHQDFWFVPDLELKERAGVYYIGMPDGEQAVISVNGQDPERFVFPSLNSDGEAIYCFGMLSPTEPDRLDMVVRGQVIDRKLSIDLQQSIFERADLFRRFDLGGIPVVRISTFSDHHTKQIEEFLRSADELRGESCVIIDLRGNGGGNTRWPREWIQGFTGHIPQLNQTLTELVSRTALVGQSNYQAWLAAGPGKGIRDQLENERSRLASRVEVFDEDGGHPYWSTAYIPSRAPIPNETTLIVITDRNVASSGEGLISYLQDQVENVVLVGENTRGALVFGHVSAHRLPHSKLLVNLPVKLNVPLDLVWREERGFEPDYWAPAEDALNLAVAAVRAGTIKTVKPLSAEAMAAKFVRERPPRFSREDIRGLMGLAWVVAVGLGIGIFNRKRGAWLFLMLALVLLGGALFWFSDNFVARIAAEVLAGVNVIVAGWKLLGWWRRR